MSRKVALVIAVLSVSIVVPAQRRGMAPQPRMSGPRAVSIMRGMSPRAGPGVMLRPQGARPWLHGSRLGRRFDRHFGRPHFGNLGGCPSLGLDFVTCRERFPFSSSFFPFAPFWGGYYVSPNVEGSYASNYTTDDRVITHLSEEVSQLNAQVAGLREENDRRNYDQQQRTNPAPVPAASSPEQPASMPTTLIFHDGRRMDVQNYAVFGKTLWIFHEQRAYKLRLSDLDLDRTRTLNDEKGVDFLGDP